MPCAASQTRTINVSASPASPSVAVSGSVVCAGQTVTVSAGGSGTGAVYTVYSAPGASSPLGTTPITLTPSATATYYVQSVSGG
ncbi:hypothetical protein, partial [Salmonella enterica]|uniref:Ig-like domain-containing protein n=1 Tax=Salmonella enterica TaxID=28901 RepID=UPI0034D333FB